MYVLVTPSQRSNTVLRQVKAPLPHRRLRGFFTSLSPNLLDPKFESHDLAVDIESTITSKTCQIRPIRQTWRIDRSDRPSDSPSGLIQAVVGDCLCTSAYFKVPTSMSSRQPTVSPSFALPSISSIAAWPRLSPASLLHKAPGLAKGGIDLIVDVYEEIPGERPSLAPDLE